MLKNLKSPVDAVLHHDLITSVIRINKNTGETMAGLASEAFEIYDLSTINT